MELPGYGLLVGGSSIVDALNSSVVFALRFVLFGQALLVDRLAESLAATRSRDSSQLRIQRYLQQQFGRVGRRAIASVSRCVDVAAVQRLSPVELIGARYVMQSRMAVTAVALAVWLENESNQDWPFAMLAEMGLVRFSVERLCPWCEQRPDRMPLCFESLANRFAPHRLLPAGVARDGR